MSATRVHRPLFSKRFFSPALPNSSPSIADTLPPYDTMHRDRGGASHLAPYRVVPAQLPPPKPDHSFTRRPKSKLALFWWRKRLWIESTFALTVYEPWEKVVVLTLFAILCTAIMIVFFKYLPRQLILMRKRSIYYLWGEDPDVNDTMLWQHLGLAAPADVGYDGMKL